VIADFFHLEPQHFMDTEIVFYTAYILMWPALTLGVLIYIVGAVWRDVRRAKRTGRDLI